MRSSELQDEHNIGELICREPDIVNGRSLRAKNRSQILSQSITPIKNLAQSSEDPATRRQCDVECEVLFAKASLQIKPSGKQF